MLRLRRTHVFAVTIFTFVLSACMAGGYALHRHVTAHNNAQQLDDLSQQLMRRAEKAVDFVVIANSEFLVAGHSQCNQATTDKLRELVLDTGTVSNLYMVSPSQSCSSFGDLSAQLPSSEVRAQWTQARNPAYRFGQIEHEGTSSIGVSWGFGTDLELVAAISADALLFDVLPNELRNTGRVELSIDGQPIASFAGAQASELAAEEWVSFAQSGTRYPLETEIGVDPDAFSLWNSGVSIPIGLAWLFFSSLVAGLASLVWLRGHDPLLEDVRLAVKKREIVPHFQPIVDMQSGSVIGCEALARWEKPNGERVSPGEFIPVVEQHGLNGHLLSAMIEQTAVGLRHVLKAKPDFYISFNVTPEQLSEDGFADDMVSLVAAHNLPPRQICIEITERQVIGSPEKAAVATKSLIAAGFRIAIDDAGTGHNGLAALQLLDASTIKIDKFFVDHIDHDPQSRVMIDMFVSVAQRYGMKTIAEGVETQDQVDVLKNAGVHSIQGFIFARPSPASALAHVIRSIEQPMPQIHEAAFDNAA